MKFILWCTILKMNFKNGLFIGSLDFEQHGTYPNCSSFLLQIVKPLLKKFNSSTIVSSRDQTEADNQSNESKQVYEDQNSYNEHLEEEYDNHLNEMLEQQQQMQQDIRVIAMFPDGRTFAIPFSMLPWGADYDICSRDDVYTITRDQIPQVQVL